MLKISTKLFLILTLFTLSFCTIALDEKLTTELTLKNARTYQQNFITGGQPSISDLETLAKKGVERIINLRGKGEFNDFNEQKVVESLGMEYINIEINGSKDLNNKNIQLFNRALSDKKTLVHCASGNRVGAFFALDANINKNKTVSESLIIGERTGLTRLEEKVKSMIKD